GVLFAHTSGLHPSAASTKTTGQVKGSSDLILNSCSCTAGAIPPFPAVRLWSSGLVSRGSSEVKRGIWGFALPPQKNTSHESHSIWEVPYGGPQGNAAFRGGGRGSFTPRARGMMGARGRGAFRRGGGRGGRQPVASSSRVTIEDIEMDGGENGDTDEGFIEG
ncbi:hypothetical protein DXG01_005847, partial [Tephrocybe rancida]